jgi:hypothetical protein
VVSLALRNAERCGCAPKKRRARFVVPPLAFFRAVTGVVPQEQPLADPRLDTLRRFVCKTRRWRRMAEDLSPELAAQGFNANQIKALGLLASL